MNTTDIVYHANNSGGYWWLDESHWRALEAAGWDIEWLDEDTSKVLGTLAREATLRNSTLKEAVESFRNTTSEDPYAEGCNCCGHPHFFYES